MKDAILKHAYFVGKSELRTPPPPDHELFATPLVIGKKIGNITTFTLNILQHSSYVV